jgi:pantetheine-phosphate adenylyltransferase
MSSEQQQIHKSHRIAVYPGTFDPITNGHIDIISRAANIFEKVFVTLAINSSKQPLFSIEQRLDMITRSVEALPRVEVACFEGLVVDFAKKVSATALIRGLRAISDFEYEFQIALMNRRQAPGIDTVFLMPDERYTYLSSSLVKEIARHGGTVNGFVPASVEQALNTKFERKQL